MSRNEIQLVGKIANIVLSKSEKSYNGLISFSEVTKETNIPIAIVQSAARQICDWLLTMPMVDDVDICDGNSFDVMLKHRPVRA